MNAISDPALESCTIIRFPENIADQIRENLKLESEKLQSLIEKDANDTYYEHSLEVWESVNLFVVIEMIESPYCQMESGQKALCRQVGRCRAQRQTMRLADSSWGI